MTNANGMNRKRIFEFINEEVYPQIDALLFGVMKPIEIAKVISEWRRKHGYPKEMTARVDDGFLFINSIPAGRIAPMRPRPVFSEETYYWEGRILARQDEIH